MDFATLIGILIALLALLVGFVMDGGHLSALLVPSAALIVFGGTLGAVVISFSKHKLKQVPAALKFAFTESQEQPEDLLQDIVDMAVTARREGVLALERQAADHPNMFLKEGLEMVIDGSDPELTRDILELDIDAYDQKHRSMAKVFEAAGGYAPTMGIIGTVMGLIHVLGNLEDPAQLAPAIAVAFSATLYGVASANVIYLPIANKIKTKVDERIQVREMMLEGILAIQAGENPQLIEKKMRAFLVNAQAPRLEQKGDEDEA